MEGQNYLGIYISKDTATVVCLNTGSRERQVADCFSISAENPSQATPQQIAALVAQACTERNLKFSEAAVALDCSMFMQHNLHSEFTDQKQIASTIRFDTEEAVAMDISDIAIAFRVSSSDETGSDLVIYTAQQKILSGIITALQDSSIDPMIIEPDVNCLSRFVEQKLSSTENIEKTALYCFLSRRNAYFIQPPLPGSAGSLKARSFLIGPGQDRLQLLQQQTILASALAGTGESVGMLRPFDSTGPVDCRLLAEKTGIEVKGVDLLESAGVNSEKLKDCSDTVELIVAFGAALACLEKPQNSNFRTDFMPYEGKKVRLQKTLKVLSISATILLIALGLTLQLRWFRMNEPVKKLMAKFTSDYVAVNPGKKELPDMPLRRLKKVLRDIQDLKSGQLSLSGNQSASAKLTLILKAFNDCAAETKLSVDSLRITAKSIKITGETSNRENTIKLKQALEKNGLKISQDNLELKAGRDNFVLTIMTE